MSATICCLSVFLTCLVLAGALKIRDKRKEYPEIIYPGTKWCGPGDIADSFEDLGRLVETDKCCRAHDNCPLDILAFHTKYHYFNYRPVTVTHCTCDETFFNCLKAINGPEAAQTRIIGDVFFGKLTPSCFRLEHGKYCAEFHWSHLWCFKYKEADEVAKIYSYLGNQWKHVGNSEEIPNKPVLQNITDFIHHP